MYLKMHLYFYSYDSLFPSRVSDPWDSQSFPSILNTTTTLPAYTKNLAPSWHLSLVLCTPIQQRYRKLLEIRTHVLYLSSTTKKPLYKKSSILSVIAGLGGWVWRTGGTPEWLILGKMAFPCLTNTNSWVGGHSLEKSARTAEEKKEIEKRK